MGVSPKLTTVGTLWEHGSAVEEAATVAATRRASVWAYCQLAGGIIPGVGAPPDVQHVVLAGVDQVGPQGPIAGDRELDMGHWTVKISSTDSLRHTPFYRHGRTVTNTHHQQTLASPKPCTVKHSTNSPLHSVPSSTTLLCSVPSATATPHSLSVVHVPLLHKIEAGWDSMR